MITLLTLKDHTADEVFKQGRDHLLTQMERSTADGVRSCKYLNNNGLKCVAGCFISDDEYDPIVEGMPWSVLVEEQAVPEVHARLIGAMQSIHDNDEPIMWETRMDELEEDMKRGVL